MITDICGFAQIIIKVTAGLEFLVWGGGGGYLNPDFHTDALVPGFHDGFPVIFPRPTGVEDGRCWFERSLPCYAKCHDLVKGSQVI